MGAVLDAVSRSIAAPFMRDKTAPAALRREEGEWRDLSRFLGIDPDTRPEARSEATYYACLKILRETLGKLPLRLMRATSDGGVETLRGHPAYTAMCVRPNPYQAAPVFWSAVENDRLHFGNAYVYRRAEPDGRVTLWRLPPWEVDVWWDETSPMPDLADVYYRWSSGGRLLVLKSYQVMHFRSSDTSDGIRGIPAIDRLRDLVSGSVGAQKFQNELIGSGLTAKAVLQYAADFSEDNVREFTRGIERYARGDLTDEGVRNIVPIPVGTTLTPLNTKLTDAQFSELKKYSAAQIAAAFGIKPQQINDMTKQSYASSQAQQEAFYQDTMLYTLRVYEEEATWKLMLGGHIGPDCFVQADTEVMLRSDYLTTVKANKLAVESGQIKPNEARRKLSLPAVEEGDVLLGNGNLIPIRMAGQQYARAETSEGDGEAGGGENQ